MDGGALDGVGAGVLLAQEARGPAGAGRLVVEDEVLVRGDLALRVGGLLLLGRAGCGPAADNGALRDQLVRIRDKAGIGEDIGALRVFDVIAWMHQGRQGQVATS
ncbi:DUF6308 family protein [Streptomyces sp. NPDC050256]|uniref:DUF6308 family protein n=1 Tax=Streptomyces sp. NPDC050256 TaxID=3365607 RepID=UPI00379E541F